MAPARRNDARNDDIGDVRGGGESDALGYVWGAMGPEKWAPTT